MSSQPQPLGTPEESWKNRLQEFTQKASLPLPTYKTCYEGLPHAPQFRSQVCVDGMCFVSANAFSNRKMAEQDAAKHAYIGTVEKVKNESSSLVREDTLFCKMIINEYALKMNLAPPTYTMNESKAIVSIFISSLVLNGVTYLGGAARSKKEAEQLAARVAILSIIESESGTTMSEIVKSKFKFYDALKKVKDLSTVPSGVVPTEDTGITSPLNKRKEVDGSVCNVVTNAIAPIAQSNLLSLPTSQIMHPELNLEQSNRDTHHPVHVFKKPNTGNLTEFAPTPTPPIEFVPPSSEQGGIGSNSGKKKSRKKKKAKKKMDCQSPLLIAAPQSSVPPCSVAQ